MAPVTGAVRVVVETLTIGYRTDQPKAGTVVPSTVIGDAVLL